MSGVIRLDLVEACKPLLGRRRTQISRLVPGHISVLVDAVDIPLSIYHSAVHADLVPTLQLSILDLDVIDHRNSLVRHPCYAALLLSSSLL